MGCQDMVGVDKLNQEEGFGEGFEKAEDKQASDKQTASHDKSMFRHRGLLNRKGRGTA